MNDTHGHGLGDEVLRRLVDLMSEGLPTRASAPATAARSSRSSCPGSRPPRRCGSARRPARGSTRIRGTSVAADLRVTVSVGVACLDAGSHPGAPGLDAADALLYVAKRAGRNAVAYRDADDGTVRLAGAAAARRGIAAAARGAFATS